MSQSQLLLIILGVIIVGVAISVVISSFRPTPQEVGLYDYQSQISTIGLIRQIAEQGRDTISGKYITADSLIGICITRWGWEWGQRRHNWTFGLFRMDSANVNWSKAGVIGVWTSPTDTNLIRISAFGPNGELIGTTDNFNEPSRIKRPGIVF